MSAELLTGVLAEHPVWDGHNDLPWAMRDLVGYDMERIDVAARGQRTHTDLPRLREGGVGAQFWSVFVPAQLAGDAAVTAFGTGRFRPPDDRSVCRGARPRDVGRRRRRGLGIGADRVP